MSALERKRQNALLGFDHTAGGVSENSSFADETDAGHRGFQALLDLEYEIDTVLIELDDLGLDLGSVSAVPPVDLDNARDCRLDLGPV
ncbi:MAG: hypothetical protein R3C97_09820 [Geminicoccaceae bacterium]